MDDPEAQRASGPKIWRKASHYHSQIPYLRLFPAPAVAIILLLVVVNIAIWTICGIILSFHPVLVSTAVLSYTLGLRHALDADHISAIDLMTRRLIVSGQKPVTVGTFFSLGHSTIVIITSLVVAASSAAISERFGAFSEIGSIIGSSISAAFLILLGAINAYILYRLYTNLQHAIHSPNPTTTTHDTTAFASGGCMTSLLRSLFRLIDRPWKMYPLGVLFGLGFDTSSEIALLGISSLHATNGTTIWLILIFPVLFTAGMCLLDTVDGAAMMTLYTSARLASDAIAVLYYQCVLTAITVVVAIVVGTLQLLGLVLNVNPDLEGPFWDGVEVASDHYDIIGGAICGSFLVFGGLAVLCYRPWRAGVERRRVRWQMEREHGDVRTDDGDSVAGGEDDVEFESSVTGHERTSRREGGDVKSHVAIRSAPT